MDMDGAASMPPRRIISGKGPTPWRLPALLALLIAVACRGEGRGVARAVSLPTPASTHAVAAPSPPTDTRPVVLFVGPSLTAGLGLAPHETYPPPIQSNL